MHIRYGYLSRVNYVICLKQTLPPCLFYIVPLRYSEPHHRHEYDTPKLLH